ncbi:MAG: helix-hairpin-helix domain-containing protein [Opitutaceae bacterium]
MRDPRKKEAANANAASIADVLPQGLAKPALRALYAHGVRTLSDLRKMSEEELSALHGIGPKALLALRDGMRKQGISFRAS